MRKGCAFGFFRTVAGGPRTSAPEDLINTLASDAREGIIVILDVSSLFFHAVVASYAVIAMGGGDADGADRVELSAGRDGDASWRGRIGECSTLVEVSLRSVLRIGGGSGTSDGRDKVISGNVVAEGDFKDCVCVLNAKSLVSLPLDMLAFSQPDLLPILD